MAGTHGTRFLVIALLGTLFFSSPSPTSAQLPPVLDPGDRHRFLGANPDVDLGPGCDGVVNGCGVDYGDLGVDRPRMYIVTGVNVGVIGTTRTATGRLAHEFSVSSGPPHRIGAKIIGIVSWRGWLQASIGAYDNTSSSEIGVVLYDVTEPGERTFVASQTVHNNSVGGQLSLGPPTFERDIGRGGFALPVDLERGRYYMVAIEATCRSTSGLVGLFTGASYSTYDAVSSILTDGFIEQTLIEITLEPDYLALIDELREEFQGHAHHYLTGRGVGHNNTEAVTTGPLETSEPAASVLDPIATAGEPELQLVTAASDRVRLLARIPRGRTATVERRTGDEAWASLFGVSEEGVVEDRSVEMGARYGYRLVDLASGAEWESEEVWVDVPTRLVLGLERVRSNPIGRNLSVGFTLPSRTPAVLTLYDVHGRVVMTREVGSMGTGRHVVDWSSAERLASGIYMLQLTQDGRSVTTKVAVLR